MTLSVEESRKVMLNAVTEKQFQANVLRLAKTLGWLAYHTFDSRRSGQGFPDLVLARERVLFVELKAQNGKVSQYQRQWEEALLKAGAEHYIWKPADWDDIASILQ